MNEKAVSASKTCPLCGQLLPPAAKTGRPMVYHPSCRRYRQLIGWIEDTMENIDPTPEKATLIRKELWYLSNVINPNNKKKG